MNNLLTDLSHKQLFLYLFVYAALGLQWEQATGFIVALSFIHPLRVGGDGGYFGAWHIQ